MVATAFAVVFTTLPAAEIADPEIAIFIARCRAMEPVELAKTVMQLERFRDVRRLKAIFRSNIPHGHFAVGGYVGVLDSPEAAQFVRTLKPLSSKWFSGINALRGKKKEHVIDVFIEAAQSGNPSVRAFAYEVCRLAGWKELAPFAITDVQNDVGIHMPNIEEGLGSLCDYAKMYLGISVQPFQLEGTERASDRRPTGSQSRSAR